MADEIMDEAVVCAKLNEALALQLRSALAYTVVAGSLRGAAYQGLAHRLAEWAAEELDGVRALVEKITSLGGQPAAEPAPMTHRPDAAEAIQGLVETERKAVAALHAVIPETGQQPRSEALEHMLEHEIMRKQHHLDALRRAAGD